MMEVCWSCGLPQPTMPDESLHYDDCPEHDEDECIVCVQIAETAKEDNDEPA